jgi:hypothetical protein
MNNLFVRRERGGVVAKRPIARQFAKMWAPV